MSRVLRTGKVPVRAAQVDLAVPPNAGEGGLADADETESKALRHGWKSPRDRFPDASEGWQTSHKAQALQADNRSRAAQGARLDRLARYHYARHLRPLDEMGMDRPS